MQRQTNRLLRLFKEFIKGYVDDIIIFLKTLAEYILYLRQIFILFKRVGVAFKILKSFIKYLNI